LAAPGAELARVELDLPDAEALPSDYMAWSCVINRSIVACDEAEWDAWDALPEPERTQVAAASWPRIFDLRRTADPGWGLDADDPIQVCFPVLRWRDIRDVTRYRARPTHEWLQATSRQAE
jgi:hypothetical protein